MLFTPNALLCVPHKIMFPYYKEEYSSHAILYKSQEEIFIYKRERERGWCVEREINNWFFCFVFKCVFFVFNNPT
jgi:hypothetical protein